MKTTQTVSTFLVIVPNELLNDVLELPCLAQLAKSLSLTIDGPPVQFDDGKQWRFTLATQSQLSTEDGEWILDSIIKGLEGIRKGACKDRYGYDEVDESVAGFLASGPVKFSVAMVVSQDCQIPPPAEKN